MAPGAEFLDKIVLIKALLIKAIRQLAPEMLENPCNVT
jgi:hypothetical protein